VLPQDNANAAQEIVPQQKITDRDAFRYALTLIFSFLLSLPADGFYFSAALFFSGCRVCLGGRVLRTDKLLLLAFTFAFGECSAQSPKPRTLRLLLALFRLGNTKVALRCLCGWLGAS